MSPKLRTWAACGALAGGFVALAARRGPRTALAATVARRRVALRHVRPALAALRRAGDAAPAPGRARAHLRRRPRPAAHARDRRSCSPSVATAPPSSCSAAPCARIPRRPQRVRAAGHELASHGDDHRLLALALARRGAGAAPRRGGGRARARPGEPPAPLFRPPHGVRSPWLARGRAGGRLPRLRVGRLGLRHRPPRRRRRSSSASGRCSGPAP